MSDAVVTQDLRRVLSELADEMIPAGADLPSANDVGISAALLDDVLKVRPDLARPLADALAAISDEPVGRRLQALERTEHIDVVALVVAGGYLMSQQVADALRYPWQEARLVRSDDVYAAIADGLLDPVVERGPIFRIPPGTTSA